MEDRKIVFVNHDEKFKNFNFPKLIQIGYESSKIFDSEFLFKVYEIDTICIQKLKIFILSEF